MVGSPGRGAAGDLGGGKVVGSRVGNKNRKKSFECEADWFTLRVK